MSTILIVGAAACAMLIMEIVAPGRRWPVVSGWWLRAIALNLVQAAMVFVAGATWDRWFAGASLWNLEDMLGRTGGAIAGYLVITFIYYWWHRARHEIPILWRIFHQVHHSPQRIEIVTSFYKHHCGTLLSLERPHAVLDRLHHPAPGKPLHPSSPALAPAEFLRPAALGHDVRHLPQSEGGGTELRVRSSAGSEGERHAARS
jgi:hypothetical protein